MGAAEILEALARAGRTLAVAESFTGGLLANVLTDVPGSSRVFRGAVVAYSNEAKHDLLHVAEGDLFVRGAVSAEVAFGMARGARDRFRTDYGVSTTGIAGPSGATAAKPVGLSYSAAVGRTLVVEDERVHRGPRRDVKAAAVSQALAALERLLATERIL